MEDYCIALICLLIFLIYVDNCNNSNEGYANLDDAFNPIGGGDDKPEFKEDTPAVIETKQQKYVPIGQKPQKLAMAPPASMTGSMKMLGAAPANMESYMLLNEDRMVGVKTIDSRVGMPYPRVGGVGNVGKDMAEQVVKPMQGGGAPGTAKGAPGAPVQGAPGAPGKQGSASKGTIDIVIVYAPWCGWSKKSLPDFKKMEAKLNNVPPSLTNGWTVTTTIYDSETPEGKAKAKELNVKGFPSVLVNVNGERKEGPRGYGEMVSFVNKFTDGNISP